MKMTKTAKDIIEEVKGKKERTMISANEYVLSLFRKNCKKMDVRMGDVLEKYMIDFNEEIELLNKSKTKKRKK